MSGGNIKVVVRCRPLNGRELARGAKCLVHMEGNQTILEPPEVTGTSARATEKKSQAFSFDKSYWSAGDRNDPGYASQQTLYDDLGVDLLNHSFEGFNTCIFAYGQTGSGKSYSMMGYGADKGIIPLTTSALFRRVEEKSQADVNLSYSVEVSYIEIYNEKVRDLLNPKNKGNLKVREHPSLGPYVEDLSKLVVENYAQMMTLMDEGNKARTVASTNMNETSSRSHAVFTLILTQKRLDPATKMVGEKVSKISLVDLAGSERQASTGATGTRLKEGANINKSLTTLGKVIAALAQTSEPKGKRRKEEFVPYRDSVLTWLLKESLGGNSKTAMIAAISPADYDETLSTLRYADAAKRIKTNAVVNEDPNAKLIRELKEELELLRNRVSQGGGGDEAVFDASIPPEKQMVTYRTKEGEVKTVSKAVLEDQLEQREKLMADFNRTIEEKMEETRKIHVEREAALEELGISVDKDMVGVHAPQKHPSLVNLNEDPLMSECLVYQLKPGSTVAGSVDGGKAQIKLSGTHICDEHCLFVNEKGDVTLEVQSEAARTFVNGKRVQPKTPVKLLHGFRVILGDVHVFRYNDPAGVRAHRSRMSMFSLNGGPPDTPTRSDSPAAVELMDWTAARREVADIECLGDQDLDKLFDDIVKVRTLRGRPDSRLDLVGDFESRLHTASVAGESIADPTTNPWGDGMTSTGTPALMPDTDTSDSRTDGPAELAEIVSRSEGLSVRFSTSDDIALEQQALTKQLKTLAQEVKRIRSQAAVARVGGIPAPDISTWTPREIVLARKAADKWKRLRNFAMAEQLLVTAGDVREANIIAKQMGRNMTYNFTIAEGPIVNPMSALDDLGGIIEFEDVSNSSETVSGPQVMVKVIDHESTSVYTWNLHRFQQQLARMRQVLAVKDKPGYSVHLSVHAPFGDSPTPSFSFIGAAQVPLRLLASQMNYTVTVPIFCAYTMEAIGSCRVDFKCAGVVRSGVATPDSETIGGPAVQSAPFGHKFAFTITVDSVKGLTGADFTEVHAQTRLSSLVGPAIASEDTFASLPVNLDKASVSHLVLRRSLSVLVTSDMVTHLANGYATIEFFARVRQAYLERLERFDLAKEAPREVASGSTPGTPAGTEVEQRPPMRRAETEFVTTEHHDILASVEILEMGWDGEYAPAEVEDQIVQLHLGVQRQLSLTLKHSSGRSLKWTRVVHASAGDLRVMKEWGEQPFAVPATPVNLQLNSAVEFLPDGTSKLIARGTWDTAAHHSAHIDRRTPSDEYIIVQLKFMVEVEDVDEPAVLALDVKMRILGRDAGRRGSLSLRTFWRSQKPTTNVVALYGLDLTPPLARTARELWRLDTAKKPVVGEKLLQGWRPRSIALVRDYGTLKRVRGALSDVQTTRIVLEHVGDGGLPATESDEAGKQGLVEKCAGLWVRQMETRVLFDVEKETDEEQQVTQRLRRLVPDLEPRLVPTVTLMHCTEAVIKRGTLTLLKDSRRNRWEEAQAILKPPFLHLYADGMAKNPSQVINVSQASVSANPEVESLLGRRYAFTVYTPTNSYLIQAASARDLDEWITVISRQKKS